MSEDTVSVARLVRPRSYEEAAAAVRDSGARGTLPGGPGRAYGDAARNAGGAVLDLTGLDRVHVVDADEGIVLCDAGVPLHRLAGVLLPLGWLPPVMTGDRGVTVGGAIAADLHGRDHHVSGSFCRQVLSLEMLTADGEVRTVTPDTELFEATAGGMGLTGIVLTATFRLLPVETPYLTVDTERAADLDALLARMAEGDHRHRYAAARIDLTGRGTATGRGVLVRADHTPLDALDGPGGLRDRGTRAWRRLQALRPRPLHQRAAVAGDVWYRAAPRARTGEIRRLSGFFHPLDGTQQWGRQWAQQWSRPYGRGGGLVRYRFALGHGREEALHRVVGRLTALPGPTLPAVLQHLGDAGTGWLSFPLPGWSLTVDLPAALPGLAVLLDELDAEVAASGGRVALAGDGRLRPDLLDTMYPRAAGFRALRARCDPRGVFTSDLARRLGL
ncbi:FAD-binding oxidoreductase [Streptomyces sp. LP11]|uniref:FAD-binding oxidoreductase n=1 Tax=Streptomyces pyxinicus TaxID=2970331 RepID=A0ABT2B8L9_9ACTN|nr:FAD-binding oxidoreductase [Streptomyces sp. LP11]MCS0604741.1 FAD-binding oxidoreductase [Streptomyces sp. LP11]